LELTNQSIKRRVRQRAGYTLFSSCSLFSGGGGDKAVVLRGERIDGGRKKNVTVSAEGEDVQERVGDDGDDGVEAVKEILKLGAADTLILP
jgi:hypothetical protein